MRYFLMSVDTTNKKWRKKESLANDYLRTESGEDVRHQIAYEDGSWNSGNLYCELRNSGERALAHPLYTVRIVLFSIVLPIENLKPIIDQVNNIAVIEKNTGRVFTLLQPISAVLAVNFDRSEIERWPSNTNLEPWHDPRGRLFLKPYLENERIPPNLHIFRMGDWPGVENIVVSEYGKEVLERCEGVSSAIIFSELNT